MIRLLHRNGLMNFDRFGYGADVVLVGAFCSDRRIPGVCKRSVTLKELSHVDSLQPPSPFSDFVLCSQATYEKATTFESKLG